MLPLECSRGARRDREGAELNRRGPKPPEEPCRPNPRVLPAGWRGLTPRWPRSLRLGSASEVKLARARAARKTPDEDVPAFSAKIEIVHAGGCRIGSGLRG